jgi:hypothetical protein
MTEGDDSDLDSDEFLDAIDSDEEIKQAQEKFVRKQQIFELAR